MINLCLMPNVFAIFYKNLSNFLKLFSGSIQQTTLIVNVHRRCFNVDIWLKMKVEPTYVYRRCFNVDKTTLKQRWITSIQRLMIQCCLNVDIWLKMKIEPMHVYRRCFDFDNICCTDIHWAEGQWQNWTMFSSIQ